MLTYEQKAKFRISLNEKIGPIELILIPHRIMNRCIVHAKTDEAKSRLVFIAEQAGMETIKRHWVPGYKYPVEDKKHGFPIKDKKEGWFNKVKFW